MEIPVLDKQKMTYEEYYKLDDGNLYQLIEGELIMSPAPSYEHQKIHRSISFIIMKYLAENNIGELLYAPADVILDENNTFQPDLFIILNENKDIIKHKGVFGTPDIIFEILSPASVMTDRHKKFDIYEKYGVKEYWLIDHNNQAIEVFALKDKKFYLFSSGALKGKVKSKIMKDFEIDISAIFPANDEN